jgi:hypothetical protein
MQHNPQPLHIRGRRVSILRGRHDVGAPFATVMDYFWREDIPWPVLQLPDVRRAAAPANHTDLPPDTFPPRTPRLLLLPAALPEPARPWQTPRPHRAKERHG